jgi:hypothetical protein
VSEKITIATGFRTVTLDPKNMDQRTLNVIATLLTSKEEFAALFAPLDALKPFEKIKAHEVLNKCPSGRKGICKPRSMRVRADMCGVEQRDILAEIADLGYDAELREYYLEYFCDECNTVHSVSKLGLTAKIDICGITMVKKYDI